MGGVCTMLKGARLLVATSLGVLAAGCTSLPAPNFGTLNPDGLDDYYLKQYDIAAVRSMVPRRPAFNDQLRVGYLELADMIGEAGRPATRTISSARRWPRPRAWPRCPTRS